ncbi:MAG: site-specific integrase [Bradyrhizobiaceae bacterium]|nr:MAG: site-specific integrase [Bradyrhizobiaceae bacterium]
MPVKLTVAAVSEAAVKTSRYEVADSIQPGLRLVVYPSGKKSWVYRYERSGGQAVKITIGPATGNGAVSLKDARLEANNAARLRHAGTDPAMQKLTDRRLEAERITAERLEAERSADNVERVLARYFADHADKLKSGAEVRRVLTRELKSWAKRRVDQIQRRDAIQVLDMVAARAPVQSKRLRAYGRHFFGWCISKEIATINPFDGTRAIREVSRDRVLTEDELRLLLRAIATLDQPRGQYVELLLLTAQRYSEVADMLTSELSLSSQEPLWTLPSTRMKAGKAHTVPLTPRAVEIITGITPRAGSVRLFPTFSATHLKSAIDTALLKVALRDAAARSVPSSDVKIAHWTLHDLRRSAATHMSRMGVDVIVIERVLGHTMRGVMGTYQRNTFDNEKRAALTIWSDYLSGLIKPQASNVVPLRHGIAE